MGKPLVGIVLGSRADFNIMKRGMESLRVMGVPYVFELASAYKTPDRVVRFAATAVEQGLEVILCAGGGAVQVASLLASHTILPVIAVPIDSTPLRGTDSLYSLIQTPPGIPVAVVGINNGENAALLATQILAIKHIRFRSVLTHARLSASQKMEAASKEMVNEYPDLCDPEKTAPAYAEKRLSDDETDPGSEDVTPEPMPAKETQERIRPGATLTHRPAVPPSSRMTAARLIPTPQPQEPGNQTEDNELKEDAAANPVPQLPPDFPPPPKFSDLTPLALNPSSLAAFPEALAPLNAAAFQEAPVSRALELAETYVETKIFEVDPEQPDEDVLAHAMMVLIEGGIVAFPTDTVYGLAADATNADAVRRLYEVKGQDSKRKSLSVLIPAHELLETMVREVPPAIESAMEKFWPGPLTILFYKHPNVLAEVSDAPSIAVRIPSDGVAFRVMKMVDRPLIVINAALGNSPAALDASEVVERFSGKIDCVLDAGKCRNAITSTVLSVMTEPFEVLREGSIPTSELKHVLGPRLKD